MINPQIMASTGLTSLIVFPLAANRMAPSAGLKTVSLTGATLGKSPIYFGILSFWPTLIRSGSLRMSRLASKIFGYRLALP